MGRSDLTFPAQLLRVTAEGFYLFVPCEGAQKLLKSAFHFFALLSDGRTITVAQRKAICATENDIARWACYWPNEMHVVMRYDYYANTGAEAFSIANCSVTCASEYLHYLIEFCLYHGVPVRGGLLSRCEDIQRYVYLCCNQKKCCLTGQPADLHHVDAVGMGRDRTEILHLGMRVLPLTREKHEEMHNIGVRTFLEKYHLEPVWLDERLCRVHGLRWEV